VTKLLSLHYPNGRTHELTHTHDVKPGEEFELYGHRWTVVGRVGRASRYASGRRAGEDRVVCRQVVVVESGSLIDDATRTNADR
jgi:hypothetical protein